MKTRRLRPVWMGSGYAAGLQSDTYTPLDVDQTFTRFDASICKTESGIRANGRTQHNGWVAFLRG